MISAICETFRNTLYQDPKFDFPHGEMRDPKYRARAVAQVQEMIAVLEELGAK